MKKSIKWLALVSLLLIVVMSFALVSCGGNDDTDTDKEATSYTVTFKHLDGTEEKVTVEAGKAATAPAVKPVDGYTVAWENADLSNVSADMTVNAVKTPIEYTITYETDGGDNNTANPAKYTIESAITLSNPKKTGYKFLGWYSDEELTTAVTEIAQGSKGNKTLYAGWELITYTITYETNGGKNDIGNPTKYTLSASDITLKPASLDGYDFEGWYSDVGYTTKVEKIVAGTTGNITLYARYELESFDVVYELNGGKNNKNNPTKFNNTDSFTFENPTRFGYTFKGWFSDRDFAEGTEVTGIVKGTKETVTVFAKWEITTNNVEYIVGNFAEVNSKNPTSYTIDDVITLEAPVNITPGYEFKGWYTTGTFTQEVTKLGDGVVLPKPILYAKIVPVVYNINYELSGGTNNKNNPATYTVENVGDNAITLADPEFLGCTFLGWYIGDEKVTTVPATIDGVTITAKWQYFTFNIEYVLNQVGATNSSDNKATYSRETDFALADPIKENVEFLGWYLEPDFATKVENTNSLSGDVTLYAYWLSTKVITNADATITATGGNGGGGNGMPTIDKYIFDGNTEALDLNAGWSTSDWYSKGVVPNGFAATIELNEATTLEGFKFYGKANWVGFKVEAYNSNGDLVFTSSKTLNNTTTTEEVVLLSVDSEEKYEDVKTIVLTATENDIKIFRIAEIVIEVVNPAYEAPTVEETPAE